jgi:hypothetical protein
MAQMPDPINSGQFGQKSGLLRFSAALPCV